MISYIRQWRGNKATSITSVHIDHILQFCEKHFETITKRKIDGCHLRGQYKDLLLCIENDIKFDAKDLKKRFVDLINRDMDVLTEDVIIEQEKNRLDHQYEEELLDLIKEK